MKNLLDLSRFYHHRLENVNVMNYSQLTDRRCNDKEFVSHPISKHGLKEVDGSYGTIAGGTAAFRNQQVVTRHHNGWSTLKTSIAKQIKYDKDWEMPGSYRDKMLQLIEKFTEMDILFIIRDIM